MQSLNTNALTMRRGKCENASSQGGINYLRTICTRNDGN